jgi:hypothetical protein
LQHTVWFPYLGLEKSKWTGGKKIDRIANQSGRVSKISNLEVSAISLHPDYKIDQCDGVLGETGKQVLKVVPKSDNRPYFTARWDQRAEHLDIDIHNVSNAVIRKSRKNKDGYEGHHTVRSSNPNKRIFEVTIKTPVGVIFGGTVSFSNTYNESIHFEVASTLAVDAQVIRADQSTR